MSPASTACASQPGLLMLRRQNFLRTKLSLHVTVCLRIQNLRWCLLMEHTSKSVSPLSWLWFLRCQTSALNLRYGLKCTEAFGEAVQCTAV